LWNGGNPFREMEGANLQNGSSPTFLAQPALQNGPANSGPNQWGNASQSGDWADAAAATRVKAAAKNEWTGDAEGRRMGKMCCDSPSAQFSTKPTGTRPLTRPKHHSWLGKAGGWRKKCFLTLHNSTCPIIIPLCFCGILWWIPVFCWQQHMTDLDNPENNPQPHAMETVPEKKAPRALFCQDLEFSRSVLDVASKKGPLLCRTVGNGRSEIRGLLCKSVSNHLSRWREDLEKWQNCKEMYLL
jgi:hypothetical protein